MTECCCRRRSTRRRRRRRGNSSGRGACPHTVGRAWRPRATCGVTMGLHPRSSGRARRRPARRDCPRGCRRTRCGTRAPRLWGRRTTTSARGSRGVATALCAPRCATPRPSQPTSSRDTVRLRCHVSPGRQGVRQATGPRSALPPGPRAQPRPRASAAPAIRRRPLHQPRPDRIAPHVPPTGQPIGRRLDRMRRLPPGPQRPASPIPRVDVARLRRPARPPAGCGPAGGRGAASSAPPLPLVSASPPVCSPLPGQHIPLSPVCEAARIRPTAESGRECTGWRHPARSSGRRCDGMR